MDGALGDGEDPGRAGRDRHVDEHFGLERASPVGDGGPDLHGARVLVDRVADVAHPPLVALAGAAAERGDHRLVAPEPGDVGLVHVRHHPHGAEIGDDEEVDRRVGLAVRDHLTRGDVPLDDDAPARSRDDDRGGRVGARADVRELLGGDAEGAQPRGRALQLGHRLSRVVLGLAELLLGDCLGFVELAAQPRRGRRALGVGHRLGVVGLGRTEIGAVDHEHARPGLDDVAGPREHLEDSPGRRRVDAHERLLVELDLPGRLDHALARAVLRADDRRCHVGRRRRLGGLPDPSLRRCR
jgi:hypothetical protein